MLGRTIDQIAREPIVEQSAEYKQLEEGTRFKEKLVTAHRAEEFESSSNPVSSHLIAISRS